MRGLPCTHKTYKDYVVKYDVDDKGTLRIFACSVCGREGPWTDSWSYFGNYECRHCWRAVVDAVVCSEACRAKHEETNKVR